MWILAVLLLAVLARLPGLTWGIPDLVTKTASYHPDEGALVGRAGFMVWTGQLVPLVWLYGSLIFYVYAAAFWIFGKLGLASGSEDYFLIARSITVAFGVASVWVVWLVGRRFFGARAGLTAACLLALMPGHVLQSQFATVDVPASFFSICCVYPDVAKRSADQAASSNADKYVA